MARKGSAHVSAPHSRLVRSMAFGYYVCPCGCGFVAVCRHCVPDAPLGVPEGLCDAEQRRLKKGKYAEPEGGRE
jgi:hypothetical protein